MMIIISIESFPLRGAEEPHGWRHRCGQDDSDGAIHVAPVAMQLTSPPRASRPPG